ncbi:menaquinone biosynthesis decarboxylase [Clostridium sp. AL.422]|nr:MULTISPECIES: menaquinone biosynthesis decarboxylase [unclassified Clostridium]MDV4151133.1 menaquinone biosynthesis decarboxylase [Clostridium sp. AL.422]
MSFKDLQAFIKELDKKGELTRIKVEVDPELEITEITDRVSKSYGKALLFENVKGSKYPVLINAMGTYERMGMALGVKNINDMGNVIEELIDMSNYMGIMSAVKSLPRLSRMVGVLPIKLPIKGSCQEVINHDPDLNELPVLKCWPEDGGKFITLPLVITKDPDTGIQNMGMYRMQVYDKNTTGMHWHWHKDGREIYEQYKKLGGKMPISVALGCDPAITYSATAPLPKMIDEMMFAGFLRKTPINMVKSITNDIYVPADAEFIIEGYVDVNEELRLEGPFGDHTGYYSLADDYPVFHVTCITHKKNPVYPTTIVGKPPMEDCYMGKATERIFLPLLKMMNPEIIDINFPLEGVFHSCVIISIDKKYPGHANKVMNSVWGMGQMMYTKMVIVVDKDVNPQDAEAVALNVFNNMDAKRDIVIAEGPLDALDHASNTPLYGSRVGIDATKKWPMEVQGRESQEDMEITSEIKEKADKVWQEFKNKEDIIDINFPLEGVFNSCVIISIDKKNPGQAKETMKSVWEMEQSIYNKMVIIVDKEVDPKNLSIVAWKVFNNIDAKRDFVICDDGRLGIDATRKLASEGHTREWPKDIEMSDEMKEYVDRRWSEYGIK